MGKEYSDKTCATCEYHTVFYEDDYTQDGCICDIGKHEYHIDNCYECDIGEFKGCPYYKKVLLED
jgi:hypothetical protein